MFGCMRTHEVGGVGDANEREGEDEENANESERGGSERDRVGSAMEM